jgi:hypothetical protein
VSAGPTRFGAFPVPSKYSRGTFIQSAMASNRLTSSRAPCPGIPRPIKACSTAEEAYMPQLRRGARRQVLDEDIGARDKTMQKCRILGILDV